MKITQQELNLMITKHEEYLYNYDNCNAADACTSQDFDISNVLLKPSFYRLDMQYLDFEGADLREADFRLTNLENAN